MKKHIYCITFIISSILMINCTKKQPENISNLPNSLPDNQTEKTPIAIDYSNKFFKDNLSFYINSTSNVDNLTPQSADCIITAVPLNANFSDYKILITSNNKNSQPQIITKTDLETLNNGQITCPTSESGETKILDLTNWKVLSYTTDPKNLTELSNASGTIEFYNLKKIYKYFPILKSHFDELKVLKKDSYKLQTQILEPQRIKLSVNTNDDVTNYINKFNSNATDNKLKPENVISLKFSAIYNYYGGFSQNSFTTIPDLSKFINLNYLNIEGDLFDTISDLSKLNNLSEIKFNLWNINEEKLKNILKLLPTNLKSLTLRLRGDNSQLMLQNIIQFLPKNLIALKIIHGSNDSDLNSLDFSSFTKLKALKLFNGSITNNGLNLKFPPQLTDLYLNTNFLDTDCNIILNQKFIDILPENLIQLRLVSKGPYTTLEKIDFSRLTKLSNLNLNYFTIKQNKNNVLPLNLISLNVSGMNYNYSEDLGINSFTNIDKIKSLTLFFKKDFNLKIDFSKFTNLSFLQLHKVYTYDFKKDSTNDSIILNKLKNTPFNLNSEKTVVSF